MYVKCPNIIPNQVDFFFGFRDIAVVFIPSQFFLKDHVLTKIVFKRSHSSQQY